MGWRRLAALLLATVLLWLPATADTGHWVHLSERLGPIPTAAEAITIARSDLIRVYSAKAIQHEEPLTATRTGDVWTVVGTLNCGMTWWQKLWGAMCIGGTAELKLSAKTGKILHVTHYQ